ncbi:MAG: LytTR family transcriptional regulator DNA-binding domain-containing protein [Peptostreptococcaceae bacterium]|nr:LytTR family transcriptional regulator DNA-binding domain-containing protein [Peptostreptococcaceae bacterium]
MNSKKEKRISVINSKTCIQINVSDIEMIEQVGRRVHVVTDSREDYYYGKIKNLEDALDEKFYHVLNGCIVNFNKVIKMESQLIYLESGLVYEIGRNNFIKTKQAFKDYLHRFPPFYIEENAEEKPLN